MLITRLADGRIIDINEAFCELSGYSRDEALGRTSLELGLWPEPTDRARIIETLRRTGSMRGQERVLQHKSGEMRFIQDSLARIALDGEECIVGTMIDVTAARRSEESLRNRETQLRLVTDNIPALISYYGNDLRITVSNQRHSEFFAGKGNSVIGRHLREVVGEQAWKAVAEEMTRRALGGETVNFQRPATRADGSGRVLDFTLVPHRSETGAVVGVYSLALDISKRKRAEKDLHLRERALESSVNPIMITDTRQRDNPVVYVNPAFESTTGYPAAEAIGRNPRFLLGSDTDQPGIEILRAAQREQCEATALLRNYRKDGTLFWNELRIAPVRDATGQVTHYVGVQNDVTERIRYQAELEHQANFDALTGLANRNLLLERLRLATEYAGRRGRLVAVLFIDLDRFKLINDSFGHATGDKVLIEIGKRLAGAVRADDTVARTGGDEFVIALADLARGEDAAVVSRKMLSALGQPLQIDGREFLLTASIGVALYPRDGGDAATLLKNADVAVYRAKDHGRNSVVFFAEEMNERAVRYLTIERDLRRALERSEFTLHYQPIVSAATGKAIGAEALLRWERAPGQLVSPADFIPIAEDSGLIVPIGDWVLATAIAQGRAWRKMSGRRLSMSVNLSARQFRDPALLDTVRDSLAATGFDPSDLILEITESTLMHNPEEAIKALNALKALGVRLSVDDFGTGYSSLAYLKRLPIDELKVDRSFVREIPDDRDDVAITRAVIELAHNLGLKVVAEGVENERQLKFLRAQRCDKVQGYLFSRPVAAAAFNELMALKRMPGADRPARRSQRSARK